MQQEISVQGLLKRRVEGGHEMVRESREEADRVREQHRPPVAQAPLPSPRIEGREEQILSELTRASQSIEESRLPGVRVTDEADRELIAA